LGAEVLPATHTYERLEPCELDVPIVVRNPVPPIDLCKLRTID